MSVSSEIEQRREKERAFSGRRRVLGENDACLGGGGQLRDGVLYYLMDECTIKNEINKTKT